MSPISIRGRRTVSAALNHLADVTLDENVPRPLLDLPAQTEPDVRTFVRRTTLDAYATSDLLDQAVERHRPDTTYPKTELARRLSIIAGLIKAEMATPVYYSVQGGYDTHYLQASAHASLLAELGSALKAFLDDLQRAGMQDRVAVLCFSEFGRRVKENKSQGSDHGTAGLVFLAGGKVQSGLHGTMPSLTDLEAGDLKMSVDFRRVYATVLETWRGVPSGLALNGSFERLPLFA